MKKTPLIFVLFVLALLAFVPLAASASSIDDIVYPADLLGGCENEDDCRAYCDDTAHINECLDFAELHNLLSDDEIEHARDFQEIAGDTGGPGGCDSQISCEAYCNDVNNINECVAFGEEHGFLEGDELEEARQIQQALAGGATLPGGCTNKDSCEAYCEDPNNINECLSFAEAAGFLSDEEVEEARRFMEIMAEGRSPGGCSGERECREYCDDDAHFAECIAFAEEAGFISAEEAEIAKKTGGKGPGGCVRDECDTYCEDPAHGEECLAFAVEHDLISEEELAHIEEGGGMMMMGGRFEGPGGCSNQKECEAYCSDDANHDECREALGGFDAEREGPSGAFHDESFALPRGGLPPEILGCLETKLTPEEFSEFNSRSGPPSAQTEGQIGRCFDELFGEDDHDREFDKEFFGGEYFDDQEFPHEEFDEFRDDFGELFDEFREGFKDSSFSPPPDEFFNDGFEHFDGAGDEFHPEDFPLPEGFIPPPTDEFLPTDEFHEFTPEDFSNSGEFVPPPPEEVFIEVKTHVGTDDGGTQGFLQLLNNLLGGVLNAFIK